MVILANTPTRLATIGIASLLSVLADRSEACEPLDLIGPVKSVVVSEVRVDSQTGVAGVRQVLRMDVSKDGTVIETTLALSWGSAGPPATSTTYYEGRRPLRQLQTAKGKTVPSMTCSYDGQGRLVEARIGSENSEFLTVETYEYGPSFIRRRTSVTPGGRSVTTQTLDANGRVIKEVVVDEATSTVRFTSEATYDGSRKEECIVSSSYSRRQCSTTIYDSRGNAIELIDEGRVRRKISYEYDSAGNWISKRTYFTGLLGGENEIVARRKIEYW
jgi:hypothetical protein